MVVPLAAAAAHATAAAGSAGATAMGLQMGKTDLDLTRDLFKLQMRQAKRLWTADWAEASVRHGEQCLQSAGQHSEAQAMAAATYFQAEKLAAQGLKLARDQDCRSYEIAWRAEVRESLRDELANQNNRFNIIMLCDTVCLSCVFSLIADGSAPTETSAIMLNMYVCSLGLSITLFSVSLWCAVIVVRRLHEHTASTLERKLFVQSEDLQKVWQHQVEQNLPTGPHEMLLVNRAYEKWIAEYIDPIGKCSIHLMSLGVVAMFFTAGLLMHAVYIHELEAPSAVAIFWSWVAITSTTVLWMKQREDAMEKKKERVYDNSWQDQSHEAGPFAKISKAAKELFSKTAVRLGSVERMEILDSREKTERDFCAETESLHRRVEALRHDSKQRAKTRKDILQLLTTAAEELDALPEELTSQLNKVLHDIDEADHRTATLVTLPPEPKKRGIDDASHSEWDRLSRKPLAAMAPDPIDAQRIPVSLVSLRKKLGEIPITTLLRLKNLSDEPLRLKSGVQLKAGRYIQSLRARDRQGEMQCHHLYPVSEIPPRTEIAIAARSSGGAWVPTSGIDGEIVYTNRDGSWAFRISFISDRLRSVRKWQVEASPVGSGTQDDDASTDKHDHAAEQYWQISKDEVDRKSNSETVISMDVRRGENARKAAYDHRQSKVVLKAGFLLKNNSYGLRLQWHQRWFVLTQSEMIYTYAQNTFSKKQNTIAMKDVTRVQPGSDHVHNDVFEMHVAGREPYRFSAASSAERDDWIQKISSAAGIRAAHVPGIEAGTSSGSATSIFKDDIEVVDNCGETKVLPL